MLKNVFVGEVGSELEPARQLEGLGITLGLSREAGWEVREGNFQWELSGEAEDLEAQKVTLFIIISIESSYSLQSATSL